MQPYQCPLFDGRLRSALAEASTFPSMVMDMVKGLMLGYITQAPAFAFPTKSSARG